MTTESNDLLVLDLIPTKENDIRLLQRLHNALNASFRELQKLRSDCKANSCHGTMLDERLKELSTDIGTIAATIYERLRRNGMDTT